MARKKPKIGPMGEHGHQGGTPTPGPEELPEALREEPGPVVGSYLVRIHLRRPMDASAAVPTLLELQDLIKGALPAVWAPTVRAERVDE